MTDGLFGVAGLVGAARRWKVNLLPRGRRHAGSGERSQGPASSCHFPAATMLLASHICRFEPEIANL